MMTLDLIVEGKEKNVFGIRQANRCESIGYMASLENKTRVKLLAVMQVMADVGVLKNTAKFRFLRDGICEFKAGSARIFCFFHGDGVICTHGCHKPKRNRLNIEIDKANDVKRRFLEEWRQT